ncbi:hypothetical protein [Streptomyces sp. MB09-02B]|uniref:hypothetical protein n=1 Tax=Streptomyces sp. MB09-02B TaxID=3028667 RepID=UPI0029B3DFED|nr:hypothetical protein [Streptomyces sp. MB09-02B]MDX3638303.1 hypothetical protein [Streptomyces sp. MB09-02B]
MDQDMVVLARVKLLSANRRVVRGAEGLWIYRLLTRVEPETYGSKLAYVLVEASASPLLRELPERRLALLDEAVEVAKALDTSNPYRAKMLARALAAREREPEGRAAEPLTSASEGREPRATSQEEPRPHV